MTDQNPPKNTWGGRRAGAGAPPGERNGNYRDGWHSREKLRERIAAMNKLWKPLPPPYRPWLENPNWPDPADP